MRSFLEILNSIGQEWQCFAVRMGFEVFVAHGHCYSFEQEIVLFCFFVDFVAQFVKHLQYEAPIGCVLFEGYVSTDRIEDFKKAAH